MYDSKGHPHTHTPFFPPIYLPIHHRTKFTFCLVTATFQIFNLTDFNYTPGFVFCNLIALIHHLPRVQWLVWSVVCRCYYASLVVVLHDILVSAVWGCWAWFICKMLWIWFSVLPDAKFRYVLMYRIAIIIALVHHEWVFCSFLVFSPVLDAHRELVWHSFETKSSFNFWFPNPDTFLK